jgi:hypothetical protein
MSYDLQNFYLNDVIQYVLFWGWVGNSCFDLAQLFWDFVLSHVPIDYSFGW